MTNCSLSGSEQRMGTSLTGPWGWSPTGIFPCLLLLGLIPTLQIFLSFYGGIFSGLQLGSLMVLPYVVSMHHHCFLYSKRWAKFSPNLLPWDSINNWWQSVFFLLLLWDFFAPSQEDITWFTGVVWVVEVQSSEGMSSQISVKSIACLLDRAALPPRGFSSHLLASYSSCDKAPICEIISNVLLQSQGTTQNTPKPFKV